MAHKQVYAFCKNGCKVDISHVINVDDAVKDDSTNPVQSGAVKKALDKKAASDHKHSYNDLTDKPTIDSTVTTAGTNAVSGAAVAAYVSERLAQYVVYEGVAF